MTNNDVEKLDGVPSERFGISAGGNVQAWRKLQGRGVDRGVLLAKALVAELERLAVAWWVSIAAVGRWAVYSAFIEATAGRLKQLPSFQRNQPMRWVAIGLPMELESFVQDVAESYGVSDSVALAGLVAYPFMKGIGIGPGNQASWMEVLGKETEEKKVQESSGDSGEEISPLEGDSQGDSGGLSRKLEPMGGIYYF